MQVASTSYRAYALDLWGFGDTTHNVLGYSLEQQSALLDRFLNEMGIGKIALVTHGLGSLVGMKFAASPQNVGRVDRIMAVNCPLAYEAVSPRLKVEAPSLTELTDWLSSRTQEANTALSDSGKADPRAISASMVGLQADNLYSSFRNLGSPIPLLLVYGEKDQAIYPPVDNTGLSSMTHPVFLENSGHFPMIDETIKFNRLLTDFLALESGQNPSELQMKEEWRRRVR